MVHRSTQPKAKPSWAIYLFKKRKRLFWFCLFLYPCGFLLFAWNYLSVTDAPPTHEMADDVGRLAAMIPADAQREFLGPLQLRQVFQFAAAREQETWKLGWLSQLLTLLVQNFHILPCDQDSTLLNDHSKKESVYVALNLYHCQDMIPNLIVQLLRYISVHEEDRVRISIYESGSRDATSEWLDMLRKLLDVFGIRHRIVTGGDLIRDPKIERIAFLARLRNAAMEPLMEWKASGWTASKVVFINDVFFCAQHIVRLTMHEADISCGMDFSFCVGCLDRSIQRTRMQRDLRERYRLPDFLASFIPRSRYLLRQWRRRLSEERQWQLGVPLVFYDKWVTHDIHGMNFRNTPPYIEDPHSADFLMQGYPIYVHACWNGMVSIDPQPFYTGTQTRPLLIKLSFLGIRFRCNYPEECQQSECFFLCHDFSLLGFDRILIDPGVRLGYGFRESLKLYNATFVQDLEFRPWHADGVMQPDMKIRRHPNRIQCCVLANGEQTNFAKDCTMFDYGLFNCTDRIRGRSHRCTVVVQ